MLKAQGDQIARAIGRVDAATDVKVLQLTGLPMLDIQIDRDAIAHYGINVADVEQLIQTAVAGTEASTVLQGFKRFELVVRLPPRARKHASDFTNLLVAGAAGQKIRLRPSPSRSV